MPMAIILSLPLCDKILISPLVLQVFYIAGNHEYYQNTKESADAWLRETAAEIENLVFLQIDYVDLPVRPPLYQDSSVDGDDEKEKAGGGGGGDMSSEEEEAKAKAKPGDVVRILGCTFCNAVCVHVVSVLVCVCVCGVCVFRSLTLHISSGSGLDIYSRAGCEH